MTALHLWLLACGEPGPAPVGTTTATTAGTSSTSTIGSTTTTTAPCVPELEVPYDGIDQDCDGSDLVDVDGDGFVAVEAGGDDCDDTEPLVNPAAAEVCGNGVDDDCDGTGNHCEGGLGDGATNEDADPVFSGDAGTQYLGLNMVGGQDLTGDGAADLAATVNMYVKAGTDDWAIVFSGSTSKSGDVSDVGYLEIRANPIGVSALGIGDINCDGGADLLHAGGQDPEIGSTSRALLNPLPSDAVAMTDSDLTIYEDHYYDGTGPSLASDLDDDGCPDWAVSATGHTWNNRVERGLVSVFFHGEDIPDPATVMDGQFRLHGRSGGDYMGTPLQSGDVNSDGVADLLAGADESSGALELTGAIGWFHGPLEEGDWLFQEVDGAASGSAAWEFFAYQASRMGDTDGDGHEDILVGNHTGGGTQAAVHPGGYVYLLPGPLPSGTTTAVDIARAQFFTDDGHLNALGHAVELPGDLTGDGQPEIVMSAKNIQWDYYRVQGAVYIYPGSTSGAQQVEDAPITLRTVSGNRFGDSLAPSGPLDAAGTVDLWVGDGSGTGAVMLFHLATAGK